MRIFAALLLFTTALWAADDDWARWRGPFENGMARGDAPTEWGDGKNVAWRTPIPGLGFSSPVIWGDRIFVTTAVPTGKTTPVQAATGRAGGGAGAGREHKFVVMCLDRKTGKVLIAHEAAKTHGIGAEVAAIIAEGCLFDLDAPVQRLCGPDIPAMPYAGPMEKFYMLSPKKCLEAMRNLAQF